MNLYMRLAMHLMNRDEDCHVLVVHSMHLFHMDDLMTRDDSSYEIGYAPDES